MTNFDCQQCQKINEPYSGFCTNCGVQLLSGGNTVMSQPGNIITIGRSAENTMVVNHSQVSWEHARLTMDPLGQWWVEDLGSTNGTFVNDHSRKISRQQVSSADVLFLGSHMLQLDHLLGGNMPHQCNKTGSEATISVGRGDTNNLILDYSQVSWEHAMFSKDAEGQWWVEDLNSSNGTYINDRSRKIFRQHGT